MSDSTTPLNILYQDEWIVAVDKPAGHLVHPADSPQEGDQVTMKILRDQIGHLVYSLHRIDRPTTGVLLFGIDQSVSKHLHQAFENHEIEKTYWAVVNATPNKSLWRCTEPIQKSENSPIRDADTSFKLLATREVECLTGMESSTLSLIEARPHSGRYHQIRRHLLHAGMPIIGDYRYGGIDRCDLLGEKLGIGSRMLLQSKSLTFSHPFTGDTVSIQAPVDPCFKKCFPDHASFAI
ncbi:pseudouridine synthase [Oceaniferula spumae]